MEPELCEVQINMYKVTAEIWKQKFLYLLKQNFSPAKGEQDDVLTKCFEHLNTLNNFMATNPGLNVNNIFDYTEDEIDCILNNNMIAKNRLESVINQLKKYLAKPNSIRKETVIEQAAEPALGRNNEEDQEGADF